MRGRRRIAALATSALGAAALGAATLPGGAASAAGPNFRIYVPVMVGNAVDVMDGATGLKLAKIGVGDHPLIANATPDGKQVFVDNLGIVPGKVSDIATQNLIQTSFHTGGIPLATVLSTDGKELYVTEANYSVQVVDTATDSITRTFDFPVGFGLPCSIQVSPDNTTIYLAFVNSEVGSYSATTGKVIHAPVTTDVLPAWLTISRDGKHLYSLNWFGDDVDVFDTATFRKVAVIKDGTGAKPAIAQESPDGKKLYITNYALKTVTVADTTTWKVIDTISVPGLAMGIGFGPDGKGYISDWGGGSTTAGNPFIATGVFIGAFFGVPYATSHPGDLIQFDPSNDRILRSTPTDAAPGVFDFTTP
jgi:YVTN family beta-propeller protein